MLGFHDVTEIRFQIGENSENGYIHKDIYRRSEGCFLGLVLVQGYCTAVRLSSQLAADSLATDLLFA